MNISANENKKADYIRTIILKIKIIGNIADGVSSI